MTFSFRHIVGILAYHRGDTRKRKGFWGTLEHVTGDWPQWATNVYLYAWGCHCGHLLEFSAAFACYIALYSDGTWQEEAKTWQVDWVARIFCFNLFCECILCNFWHYFTYASDIGASLKPAKFNSVNQYQLDGTKSSMHKSETGNLEREITFTTLGWLQSAAWQCLFTHLWALGVLPCYAHFWNYPLYSVVLLAAVTYWREIHFFFCHRAMHPWWDTEKGLLDGDMGAFLYRHVHSLHHKSYNPGPWSGLCMHPVEHLFYYSCATLPPLFLCVHPLHYLYAQFHASISPLGGHDGHGSPSADGGMHYLHHAKFESNYGVIFPINGNLEYIQTGEVCATGACASKRMHDPEDEPRDQRKTPLLDTGACRYISLEEVAKHASSKDCWIVLYGNVLDVTEFLDKHPGGKSVMLTKAGQDATAAFERIHRSRGGFELIDTNLPNATIGTVDGWMGPSPPIKKRKIQAWFPGVFLLYPLAVASALLAKRHAIIT